MLICLYAGSDVGGSTSQYTYICERGVMSCWLNISIHSSSEDSVVMPEESFR